MYTMTNINIYYTPGGAIGVHTLFNGIKQNAPYKNFDFRVEKRFRIGETFSIGA
jgi:hypothetical protein